MARAALLHLLRYRTAAAAAAAEPLSAFRCLMTRSNSKTPAAGIKWAGFCRPFSSKAALNDVIGNDTDSSVAVMEPQTWVMADRGKLPVVASRSSHLLT